MIYKIIKRNLASSLWTSFQNDFSRFLWKQNKNDENTVIYMETEWKHFWPTLTKKTLAI